MGRRLYKDVEQKEKFIQYYQDVINYRFNIEKICKAVGITYDTYLKWMETKDFKLRLSEAQKRSVNHLLEHYLSLFLDHNDRQAGETILEILDPDRFSKSNSNDKDSIVYLIKKINQLEKKPNNKNDKSV